MTKAPAFVQLRIAQPLKRLLLEAAIAGLALGVACFFLPAELVGAIGVALTFFAVIAALRIFSHQDARADDSDRALQGVREDLRDLNYPALSDRERASLAAGEDEREISAGAAFHKAAQSNKMRRSLLTLVVKEALSKASERELDILEGRLTPWPVALDLIAALIEDGHVRTTESVDALVAVAREPGQGNKPWYVVLAASPERKVRVYRVSKGGRGKSGPTTLQIDS